MKKELINQLHSSFEGASQSDHGVEFWYAREIQRLLGYEDWKNFVKVIEKAKEDVKKIDRKIKSESKKLPKSAKSLTDE
jgi:hypothetical protein